MKTVCAWCRAVISDGDGPVSHGICPQCRDGFATLDGMSLQRFIDRFSFPVVVLNAELKPIAVNREGSSHGAKVTEESTVGEVVECAHSKLPERCGNTVHCAGCVLRQTLNSTNETGRPHTKIPAKLNRGEEASLLISTVKTDGSTVLLMIEPVVD